MPDIRYHVVGWSETFCYPCGPLHSQHSEYVFLKSSLDNLLCKCCFVVHEAIFIVEINYYKRSYYMKLITNYVLNLKVAAQVIIVHLLFPFTGLDFSLFNNIFNIMLDTHASLHA